MLSHAQDAPSPPPPSERFGGWYQAILFVVLMAGAGAFAVMATRVEPPPAAIGLGSRAQDAEKGVVSTSAGPVRLLVLVESRERAAELLLWREVTPVAASGAIASVEISGPLPPAALEEAIAFANVACALEGCEQVTVLDLRGQ